jgi:electron transfer flavoprotein alpha subunit
MALKINQNKIEPKTINSIVQLCPFNAIEFKNNILSINANCKMCKICTKKGDGVIE